MPTPVINDGVIPFGCPVLTLTLRGGTAPTDNVDYVCDDFNLSKPTKPIRRTNEEGKPSGSIHVEDVVSGSATLQLAIEATRVPGNGDTFVHKTVNYFVTNVDEPYEKEGYRKVNIKFEKKYN